MATHSSVHEIALIDKEMDRIYGLLLQARKALTTIYMKEERPEREDAILKATVSLEETKKLVKAIPPNETVLIEGP